MEHSADEWVKRGRTAQGRGDESGAILGLLISADDIADGLESAIYWTSLLADVCPTDWSADLQNLADLVTEAAQEYVKAVENARCLHRGSSREEVSDFLEAVDRIVTLERRCDVAHRQAQARVLNFTGDFRQWHLVNGVADKLEGASDALMRSIFILWDDILGFVLRQ